MFPVILSVDKLVSMSRTDSVVDCAVEAISDSGIGVGTGFVGLGLGVAAEDC
jgi:hypothetical protein